MKVLLTRTAVLAVLALSVTGCTGQAAKNTGVGGALSTSISDQIGQALPAGVTELRFNEFFKLPVGPRGLEPTEKLLSLKDKQIRIVGYMVQAEEPAPGLFMLSPIPVNIPEKEDGPSDDLPGSTLFVHMPKTDADKILAYRPGLWELVGTLKLGGQEEANGRVSYVRLMLDQTDTREIQEARADAQ